MNAKLSKVNQSIEKTIQIVEVMARGKGPMRLQDVAKKCGMPASTVMRMGFMGWLIFQSTIKPTMASRMGAKATHFPP